MKKLSLRAAQSAVRGTAPESEVVGLDGTPLPPTPLKETAAREIFSNLDRRPGDFLAMRAVSPGEQDGRIRRAFAGSALLRDEDKLEYLRSVLHQVHEKYRTVNRGFVEIGLILLDAQRNLREDYDRLEEDDTLLPFTKSTASKLRTIAAKVQEGVITREVLPPYTIAYRIARLPPPLLQAAREANLIRPDVRMAEVTTFLQAHRPTEGVALSSEEVAILIRERDRLRRQESKLLQSLRDLRSRVAEIDRILDPQVARS